MSDERLPPLLPVVETGTTIDAEGRTWPTAMVDATGHPDVADLGRVHAIEGVGDISTTAAVVRREPADLLLLGVRLSSPVRASFAIAFRLPDHLPTIRSAIDAGQLVIATTPPPSKGEAPPLWLAVDLVGARLARALAGGEDSAP